MGQLENAMKHLGEIVTDFKITIRFRYGCLIITTQNYENPFCYEYTDAFPLKFQNEFKVINTIKIFTIYYNIELEAPAFVITNDDLVRKVFHNVSDFIRYIRSESL